MSARDGVAVRRAREAAAWAAVFARQAEHARVTVHQGEAMDEWARHLGATHAGHAAQRAHEYAGYAAGWAEQAEQAEQAEDGTGAVMDRCAREAARCASEAAKWATRAEGAAEIAVGLTAAEVRR